jgi:hypothetical protein
MTVDGKNSSENENNPPDFTVLYGIAQSGDVSHALFPLFLFIRNSFLLGWMLYN